MNQFTQGQTVRLTANFKTFAGAQVDPATITFRIKREADDVILEESYEGSISDSFGEIIRVSAGIYYMEVDTTPTGGIWDWRILTTTPINATQGQFYVTPMIFDDSSS